MNKLDDLRGQIDAIDAELLPLLAKRFEIIQTVGTYKQQAGLEANVPQRRETVRANWVQFALSHKIDPVFINQLFDLIHDYALTVESEQGAQ